MNDRNLYLDSITVGSQVIPAAHRALSYDAGAIDGEYVYSSDGTMLSTAAIRLTERYAYDQLGNLTTKAGMALRYGANGNGTGAGPHQARSINGVAQSFDANGNLTSGRGRSITWDPENRPWTIDGATYTYDGEGRRVKVVSSQGTTVYVEGLFEETVGVRHRSLYQLNGQVVAVREASGASSTLSVLHGDHLGSISVVTNSSGGVVGWQEFDPWGAVRPSIWAPTSVSVPQTTRNYTGQILDATGLLFYNARYYDPALGRFISADTIIPGSNPLTVWPSDSVASGAWGISGSGPANPQELNRYSYGLNNPVRNTDPTGHCVPYIGDCRPFFEPGVTYTGWEDFKQYSAGVVEDMGSPGAAIANLLKADTWVTAGRGVQAVTAAPNESLEVLREELVDPVVGAITAAVRDPLRTTATAVVAANDNPRAVGQALGGAASTLAVANMALGREIPIGKDFRLAPLGNRTPHPTGQLPHYHRRGVGPNGVTKPGQGIGRHRPWDTKSTDKSWRDRF